MSSSGLLEILGKILLTLGLRTLRWSLGEGAPIIHSRGLPPGSRLGCQKGLVSRLPLTLTVCLPTTLTVTTAKSRLPCTLQATCSSPCVGNRLQEQLMGKMSKLIHGKDVGKLLCEANSLQEAGNL